MLVTEDCREKKNAKKKHIKCYALQARSYTHWSHLCFKQFSKKRLHEKGNHISKSHCSDFDKYFCDVNLCSQA